jgi:hypothetical protein
MNRFWLALLFVVSACEQNKPEKASANVETNVAAPSNAPTSPPTAPQAVPSNAPSAAQTSRFSGAFSAQPAKSATTKKDGAPSGWEKDDGKAYSGDCKLTLFVEKDGKVQGDLTGALGDLKLRGWLADEDLRATVVPSGDDAAKIQNGTLSLTREGDGFKGTLTAATGNSLVLRRADIQVRPVTS